MDATLTIQRVIHTLDTRFAGLVDMTDIRPNTKPDQLCAKWLSRALAAFAVMALTEATAQEAAASITDGHDDLAIDAVYFESADDTLYIVQSKWHSGGQKTIEEGDCAKFLNGVSALIRPDLSQANDRLKRRETELRDILLRSEVRIALVLIHTGNNPLGHSVSDLLTKFVLRQNNVAEEVFFQEIFDLKRVYANLDPEAGQKINLRIALTEWGITRQPFLAYYGQISLADVAGWATFGRALFARNLRFYRGSTEVNDAMDTTISQNAEKFWYFNNGITMLCERLEKTPMNGENRDFGIFNCAGVSVVNGAQTVGAIWERSRVNAGLFAATGGRVQVRVISLEGCPPEFGKEITLATNNQNEIKHRDFAALDNIQRALAAEMALDGRRYAFKSGDTDPRYDEGCSIEDATIALACASPDINMSVVAKRYVGGLWKDITKPPYTRIFNDRTRARDMWRAVVVSRAVTKAMEGVDCSQIERGDQIRVHGNRFILHAVFLDPALANYKDATLSDETVAKTAENVAYNVFIKLAKVVNAKYPAAYLQPLFKNAEKCKDLLLPPDPSPQSDLFAGGSG